MEAMTPEERFTKIENLPGTLTENQLRHDSAISDLIVVSRTTLNAIGELRKGLKEAVKEWLESHRELQENHKKLQESQMELRESQKATDEKLYILIETVDRIIRDRLK
jgi:hypothetical protein